MATVEEALRLYRERQARDCHPDGKFDNGGRWWPSDQERRPCCDGIRTPSRTWPYSLMVHCRTAEHIAALLEVDLGELRRAIAATHKARRTVRKQIEDAVAEAEEALAR